MMEKDLPLRRQRCNGRSFAFAAINFAALCAVKIVSPYRDKKENAEPVEKMVRIEEAAK